MDDLKTIPMAKRFCAIFHPIPFFIFFSNSFCLNYFVRHPVITFSFFLYLTKYNYFDFYCLHSLDLSLTRRFFVFFFLSFIPLILSFFLSLSLTEFLRLVWVFFIFFFSFFFSALCSFLLSFVPFSFFHLRIFWCPYMYISLLFIFLLGFVSLFLSFFFRFYLSLSFTGFLIFVYVFFFISFISVFRYQ